MTSRWVPGLVDMHVHGVAGYDVMDGQASEIAKELRQRGIEWFCPTTVTASWNDIERAVVACDVPGSAGVHLEGPFINPEKCGAQPKEHIKPFTDEQVDSYLKRLAVVTLAPEMPGAQTMAAKLSKSNIIVSAGHTNADFKTLAETEGLSQMTHFYNAMRPFSHREPGCIDFGLTEKVSCEIIYDRVHVSRSAAQALLNKGKEWVIGVSDGTKLSGMPSGTRADMWGHQAIVKDGSARLSDGTLAGSSSTLADVFTNMWQDFGPEVAIMACSTTPRARLGLPEPEIWLQVNDQGGIEQVWEGRTPPVE